MTETPDPLPGIACRVEKLDCYSGMHEASEPLVFEPEGVEDLSRIFVHARSEGKRVTMRSGGHSFDAQALGDEIVVSMKRLDSIEIDPAGREMRVGPGARWGDILARLEAIGMAPAITVTTENATAGGTLSGDCLSRFSPAYGKEGRWIKSFDLLTPGGELLTCPRPPDDLPPERWTREQRAFFGAIGGLGYLGAVVSITYEILSIGQDHGPIGVVTRAKKFGSFDDLAGALVPATAATVREQADPRDPEKVDAIYSALIPWTESSLLFTSSLTGDEKRHRQLLNRPKLLVRIPVEWLLRVPLFSRLLWRFVFRFMFSPRDTFIDDLAGYTFFMDGNARAKRVGKTLGFKMQTIQQTFVVPADTAPKDDWGPVQEKLVKWLRRASDLFSERGLSPTLYDVLFVPADARFLLSASAELPGFAVSYAFETSNAGTLEKAKETFRELADILLTDYGGRVYLVKDVYASRETLATMYGQNAIDFFRLKRELDPHCILRNEFLERTFGDLMTRTYEEPPGDTGTRRFTPGAAPPAEATPEASPPPP